MQGAPARTRAPIRTRVNLAFALAVGVLLAIAAASYQSVTSLAETGQWIGHTHDVLAAIDAVASATTTAEAGTRGFALTGEERFLDTYQAGVRGAEGALATLRRLTADNLAEQRRVDRLEPLLREHLARLADTVALRREQGAAAAAERVRAGSASGLGESIQNAIEEMRGVERTLLAARAGASESRAARTRWIIVIGSLAVVAGHGGVEPAHLARDRAAARDRSRAARLRGALPAARRPQPRRDRAHPPRRGGARVQPGHGAPPRLPRRATRCSA